MDEKELSLEEFLRGLSVATFIIIFCWILDKYRKEIDVYFVTMNDPDCSNINNFWRHSRMCKNKNCKAKLQMKIVEYINGAKKSIEIAMYNLTNKKLIEAIQLAQIRGVRIRIIVDQSMLTQANNRHILQDSENHLMKLRDLHGKTGKILKKNIEFIFIFFFLFIYQ